MPEPIPTPPAVPAAPPAPAPAPPATPADPPGPDADDEAAEADWQAKAEAQQRINRSLERKGRKDLQRIAELEALVGKKPGDAEAPDPEKIRADVRAELREEMNRLIVGLKAEALLAAKVNITPAAAVRLLDLSEVEVGQDGKVDTEALNDAIVKLLKDEPHLAVVAQGAARFQGTADQGPRGAAESEEQQLTKALAEATTARDFGRAVAIRQRIAALAAAKAT
jgi:hypothetical protein